jgi:hypothetical protein
LKRLQMFPQKAVHPKSGDSRLTVEDSLKFGIALARAITKSDDNILFKTR